jgi:tetratricopeptide (TPR) repeat protein
VAAFELLAGERPFMAPTFAAQARQHVEAEPPLASERRPALPPAIDQVLIRGIAKDPDARYETAGSFVAALKSALEEPATAATRRIPDRQPAAPALAAGAARSEEFAPRARPAAPAARSGAAAITAASGPRRGTGRMVALTALVIVAAGVALLGILGQSGSSNKPAKVASAHKAARTPVHHRSRHKAKPAAASSTTAAGTAASAPPATTASSASPPPPTGATNLQLQGHQQLIAGSYPSAISTLQQALHSSSPGSLTYAYALYDLGRALMLSGDPHAAIPVLEQRLKIPNQTPVVQQTLDQARRQAGQASSPTRPPASSGGGSQSRDNGQGPSNNGLAHGHGHHGAGGHNTSGGAGLPSGD